MICTLTHTPISRNVTPILRNIPAHYRPLPRERERERERDSDLSDVTTYDVTTDDVTIDDVTVERESRSLALDNNIECIKRCTPE